MYVACILGALSAYSCVIKVLMQKTLCYLLGRYMCKGCKDASTFDNVLLNDSSYNRIHI